MTYTLLLEWTNSLTGVTEGNKTKDALPSNPAREERADKESGHKTEWCCLNNGFVHVKAGVARTIGSFLVVGMSTSINNVKSQKEKTWRVRDLYVGKATQLAS